MLPGVIRFAVDIAAATMFDVDIVLAVSIIRIKLSEIQK